MTSQKKTKPKAPAAKRSAKTSEAMSTEQIEVKHLKFHPRNYREHPPDQLEHIMYSIRQHGFYRNVVVARDNTVLAGHGVVQASLKLGRTHVPIVRMNLDPHDPRALKLLVGDNEIGRLAAQLDGQLKDLLKDMKGDLMGTGFDEAQASAFSMLTRPPDDLIPKDEAGEWEAMGIPYEHGDKGTRLVLQFRNEEDRQRFVEEKEILLTKAGKQAWSAWWPPQGADGEVVKWVGATS